MATVNSYSEDEWTGWIRLYNLTFLIGLAMSFIVFWMLSCVFPPPGLGQESPFSGDEILYGVSKLDDTKEPTVQGEKEKQTACSSV